ncbi:MAG: SRPBCC family protein [Actinomycetota bacterium]
MEVTASVEIARPPAEVFAYLADMANNPVWQRGQQWCEWTSEPPLDVGSTYDQVASFLGRTITSSFEVVEFEPGSRIRIKTTGGTMPIDVTREVAPAGDDTSSLVSAVVRGEPAGLLGVLTNIAAPLMRMMVRNSVRGDYQRLKEILEERA